MKRPLVYPSKENKNQVFSELIQFFNETLGFYPNSVMTMYHRPEIAIAFIALNKAIMTNKGSVTSSLKRLIGYISSHSAGCKYCQAHTIRAAERYGAEEEKINNIWEFRTYKAFSEAERAALEFAIASSITPNAVDNRIAENLRQHWDDGEIVEITGVIALFGYLNRWNDSMGTELEKEAIESGEKYLGKRNWTTGKHKY